MNSFREEKLLILALIHVVVGRHGWTLWSLLVLEHLLEVFWQLDIAQLRHLSQENLISTEHHVELALNLGHLMSELSVFAA